MLGDLGEPGTEGGAPDLVQLEPVVLAAAARGGDLPGGRFLDAFDARPPERDTQLVQLDLEGDHRWDEVIDIRSAGDEHGEGAVAVVIPAPPPAGRADFGPLGEGLEPPLREDLGRLPHDHEASPEHRVGQAPDRIEQGPEVEFERSGEPVQARSHRLVGVFEHSQLGLAAAPQDGRVGPVVDLDGVNERRLLSRRLAPRQA